MSKQKSKIFPIHKISSLGATFVEAAVVLPLLIILLFFVIDVGRYAYTYVFLLRAAHVGADVFSKSVVEIDTDEEHCSGQPRPDDCQLYDRFFERAATQAIDAARTVAGVSASQAQTHLRPFTHYTDAEQQYSLPSGSTQFDVAILRPGERALGSNGEYFDHPTRPFGTTSEDNLGWPSPSQSWLSVLETHPVAVHLEASFRPIIPFLPELTVSATQMAYRRAGQFVEGAPPVPTAVCGDDEIGSGEECDGDLADGVCIGIHGLTGRCVDCQCVWCGDGELNGIDECEPPGSTCSNGGQCTETCKCISCGNGRHDGGEDCDTSDPNGGNEVCQDDHDDQNAVCSDCVCLYCGDGIKNNSEICDGESGIGELGCESCNADCTCAQCGDGTINGSETCDADNGTQGQCADGQVCINCQCEYCGDGIKNLEEECDRQDGLGSECRRCTPECLCNICGDGYVLGGEKCDAQNGTQGQCQDGETCNECLCEYCGDGIRNNGEICDGQDGVGEVGCESCNDDCTCETCGDGEIGDNEQCEDDDDCIADHGAGAVCSGCGCIYCGDGIKNLDEQCDGDDGLGDTCSSCRPDCTCNFCGDGEVSDPEQCDGNSAPCITRYGVGSSCENDSCLCLFCGDGIKNNSEECDGGSGLDGNGCESCNANCECEACGDNHQGDNEQCDGDDQVCKDHTNDVNARCSGCVCEYCGDGIKQDHEVCDGSDPSSSCSGDQVCNSACICEDPDCPSVCNNYGDIGENCANGVVYDDVNFCEDCTGCSSCSNCPGSGTG
ncbi:MAG: pilus assembly protein [Bdellovibrionales bacterium]|nr:pilus assembly protein [Bdellovibrionales bacterium]